MSELTTVYYPEESKEESTPEKAVVYYPKEAKEEPTPEELTPITELTELTEKEKKKYGKYVDEYENFFIEKKDETETKIDQKGFFIKIINKILKLHNDIKKPIDKSTEEDLDEILLQLNSLIKKGPKFEISENDHGIFILGKEEQQPNRFGFMPTLNITSAEGIIEKYIEKFEINFMLDSNGNETDEINWGDELSLKNDLYYSSEINTIINDINHNQESTLMQIIKKDSEFYKKMTSFSNKFVENNEENKRVAFEYMDTIKINGALVYKDNIALKEKDYKSPGKWAEYIICGHDNKLAEQIWKSKGNMQITDGIVEDIYCRMGLINNKASKKFCIDNVDLVRKRFSESKAYINTNYRKYYNINANLKQTYYHELIKQIKETILDYSLSDDNNIKKSILKQIKSLQDILTNRDNFDKDFYKNNRYMSIGISLNKFSKVEIPVGYDYDNSPSTEREIEYSKEKQQSQYLPIIDDERYILGINMVKGKDMKKRNFFNKTFNEEVTNGERFKYDITVKLMDAIVIYNFTDDRLLNGKFLQGTYKIGYSFDSKNDEHLNSIELPIEQFTPIIDDIIHIPTETLEKERKITNLNNDITTLTEILDKFKEEKKLLGTSKKVKEKTEKLSSEISSIKEQIASKKAELKDLNKREKKENKSLI